MLNKEAKMTEQEMEKVVGGCKYYSKDYYRRHKITVVDDGATCYYKGHEISEDEAAAIVFYKDQYPPKVVESKEKAGWETFLHTVTSHRSQQWMEFERQYKQNCGV